MATSTSPTPRKRAARAPQDRRPKASAPEREVAAETDDSRVAVPFGDGELRILPPTQWRQSTNELLYAGRFNDWAKSVLDEDGYATWVEADPTNAEVGEFVSAAMGALGFDSPGN